MSQPEESNEQTQGACSGTPLPLFQQQLTPADTKPVCTIMTAWPVTVSMDDSLETVRVLFDRHGFRHLPVLETGKCVGVLSDRDLLRELSPFVGRVNERSQDTWTKNKRAHQVMTRRVVSVHPSTTIAEACALMFAERVHCLLVINENEKVVGVVSSGDILAWVATKYGLIERIPEKKTCGHCEGDEKGPDQGQDQGGEARAEGENHPQQEPGEAA